MTRKDIFIVLQIFLLGAIFGYGVHSYFHKCPACPEIKKVDQKIIMPDETPIKKAVEPEVIKKKPAKKPLQATVQDSSTVKPSERHPEASQDKYADPCDTIRTYTASFTDSIADVKVTMDVQGKLDGPVNFLVKPKIPLRIETVRTITDTVKVFQPALYFGGSFSLYKIAPAVEYAGKYWSYSACYNLLQADNPAYPFINKVEVDIKRRFEFKRKRKQ